jgi:glutathione S-transferase
MADVTIYGVPQSTFTRTCCMTCEEKGIGYERLDAAPHSAEILAYNPTGKIPGFRHGDLVLWESGAISRYLDETFDGTSLQPEDPVARARMNLWIGMVGDSIAQTVIRDIVLPRFGIIEKDEASIKQAAEKLENLLQIADETLQKSSYLAGDQLSLADLFLAPKVFWLDKTPEGQAALPKYPALRRWYQAMSTRQSFQTTIPPMPGQAAA